MTQNVSRRSFVKGASVATSLGIVGASVAAAEEGTVPVEPDEVRSCDVCVVGTGMSGMVAAISALEGGAEVIVLEKLPACGGASVMTEVAFGNGSRMQNDNGHLYTDFELLTNECEFHNWHVDRELWSRIVAVSGATLDWFMDTVEPYGGGFSAVIPDPTGTLRVAHMYKPVEIDGETYIKGAGQMKILEQVARNSGATILTETPATHLQLDEEGAVTGVWAESPSGTLRIDAKAVIIATGGFSGNADMIGQLGRNAETMLVRGLATNTADGILMAREAGADHRGSMCAMLLGPSLPFENVNDYHYANSAACLLGYPVWVNQNGMRFMPETGLLDTATSNAIDMQNHVYSIFDDEQMDRYNAFVVPEGMNTYFEPGTVLNETRSEIEDLIEKGVDYIARCDSLEELAEKLGIPTDALNETVERYNQMVEGGEDLDFGKDPSRLAPVATPPFYGFTVCTNQLGTIGGVRINGNAQVLRPSNEPIAGLYCVGCDCDGFTGETYGVNLPGSAQCICMCTGRLAGLHASAHATA